MSVVLLLNGANRVMMGYCVDVLGLRAGLLRRGFLAMTDWCGVTGALWFERVHRLARVPRGTILTEHWLGRLLWLQLGEALFYVGCAAALNCARLVIVG